LIDGDEINLYSTDPITNDTDNDNMPDGWEISNNLNATLDDSTQDPDLDGLNNLYEYQNNTDPNNLDSDDDGLSDGYEIFITNTDPNDPDSDNDGLSDGYEKFTTNTNPNDPDSDDDGLTDEYEVITTKTDPNDPDSDDDELIDGDEINLYITDPINNDTDNDNMPDGWEIRNNLNATLDDSTQDPDLDELNNLYEFQNNTDPNDPDSDDDGLSDGYEVSISNTDPMNADTDNDGYSDGWETTHYFDPNNFWSNPTVLNGLIIMILLVIISIGSTTTYLIKKRNFHRKLETIKRDLNLYELNKKNLLEFLKEKFSAMLDSFKIIDLAKYSPEIFEISMNLISQIKVDLSNIEFYSKNIKTSINRTQIDNFLNNERNIINSLEKKIHENKIRYDKHVNELQNYFSKNNIINPGLFILLLNGLMKNDEFKYRIINSNYKNIEHWAQMVIIYRAEHKKVPDKKELWKLGIPIDRIDMIMEYINIPIKTPVFEMLSLNEIEYFDDLSVKVIKYMIDNDNFKLMLEDLVIYVGLSIKDAKLIMLYISELISRKLDLNVKFK